MAWNFVQPGILFEESWAYQLLYRVESFVEFPHITLLRDLTLALCSLSSPKRLSLSLGGAFFCLFFSSGRTAGSLAKISRTDRLSMRAISSAERIVWCYTTKLDNWLFISSLSMRTISSAEWYIGTVVWCSCTELEDRLLVMDRDRMSWLIFWSSSLLLLLDDFIATNRTKCSSSLSQYLPPLLDLFLHSSFCHLKLNCSLLWCVVQVAHISCRSFMKETNQPLFWLHHSFLLQIVNMRIELGLHSQ